MDEKYEVLHLIGEGSFGRVFKGRNKSSNEKVALKLIPKVGKSERDIETLRQEVKIQRRLNHPNIVKVIEAFETKNELVVVTEFVPGELHKLFDLYKKDDKTRKLPESRVREIAFDVLSALHYLHQNRILHRDVKPQNILIDSEGKAKLCDFGFARNLGLQTHVLTSIKGTPLYMAPELIEEQPYDYTADLWSVGCILYELCVGHPPFQTNNLFQLIKKVRYDSVQFPNDENVMSPDCRKFLQGLLEKDSRKRSKWPEILVDPFVKDFFDNNPPSPFKDFSFTDPMSESQELAKEIQRQDKAKLLQGGSQTIIKLAQKYEANKKGPIARRLVFDPAPKSNSKRGRRNSEPEDVFSGFDTSNKFKQPLQKPADRRHSDVSHGSYTHLMPTKSTYLVPQPPLPKKNRSFVSKENEEEIVKKLEELNVKKKNENEEAINVLEQPMLGMDMEVLIWPEWSEFLDSQFHEIVEDLKLLGRVETLEMLLRPLRNMDVISQIVGQVTKILIQPFTFGPAEDTMDKILKNFVGTQVMYHLVLSLNVTDENLLELVCTLISKLLLRENQWGNEFCLQFVYLIDKSGDIEIELKRLIKRRNFCEQVMNWLIVCTRKCNKNHPTVVNTALMKILTPAINDYVYEFAPGSAKIMTTLWMELLQDVKYLPK